ALGEDLGVRREAVAVEHRSAEAELVEAQLRDRVLRGVLRRKADHDRGGDEAEDDPLPEGRAAHLVLVVVGVGGVHHELREKLVLDLADRRAARVAHLLADLEVLEPAHHLARGRKASEMIRYWISELPSKILVRRASRQ